MDTMKNKTKSTACIVFWDDENGTCVPMTWDADCEGAIELGDGDVALFPDRKAANLAIHVSVCNARLMEAQGKPANSDFTTGRKNLKIRQLKSRPY